MASSQIACVNFLLPLVDIPGALTAVLNALDDDVTGAVDIENQGTSCPVELEWIGLDHALARLPQLTHDFDDFSSFDSRNALISLSPIFVIPL